MSTPSGFAALQTRKVGNWSSAWRMGNFVGLKGACKLLEDLPNKLRDHLGLMIRRRKSVGKMSGKRRESVGKTAERVLSFCETNPMVTIPEMAKEIGVSDRSIERHISNLQDWNLLRRVGGRKEGRWEVIQNESHP